MPARRPRSSATRRYILATSAVVLGLGSFVVAESPDGVGGRIDVEQPPEDAAAAAAAVGRFTNEELVALMRNPRVDLERGICLELMGRTGLVRSVRREAIERLAALGGTDFARELVTFARSKSTSTSTPDEVHAELGELLVTCRPEELKPHAYSVLRIAKYGKTIVPRKYGWAGYVLAVDDANKALTTAKTSTTRLEALLRGLRHVPDRRRIAGLRPAIVEFARTHENGMVRAASFQALVACDPSVATIDELLPLVNTPPHGFAALVALAEIPPDEFPAERIAAYVAAFVQFVDRQEPQRRVLIANRARDSWAHASRVAERLLEGEPRDSARAELDRIAVQTIVLRTVRRELRFDRTRLAVRAGRVVAIRLVNADDLPQNLVIVTPGGIEKVGHAADGLPWHTGAVPELPEVVASIGNVQPHETATLVFVAPSKPGDYHFISTIGEHWRTMQGTLVVTP